MVQNKQNRPKVGVAVIIEKEGKILLGKRKNAHGEGDWCFPGGHLEYQESFEECAIRETKEETGLEIQSPKFKTITNDIFEKERKHYITIFMSANLISGEPEIMEPEKCEEWKWYSWNNLPKNLFLSTKNFLKQENE